jgi:hypothetical protein
MIERKSWEEFRNFGLLWWINMILHTLGWAIVIDIDKNGVITEVYPARVKFRGFDEESNSAGYQKVTKFLKENINDLEDETSV